MMKFYGRNNCKIPLDLVIGKNEKIVLQILSNLTEEVTNRLFFTFVSQKTTEKKVMKFVKDIQSIDEVSKYMEKRPELIDVGIEPKLVIDGIAHPTGVNRT